MGLTNNEDMLEEVLQSEKYTLELNFKIRDLKNVQPSQQQPNLADIVDKSASGGSLPQKFAFSLPIAVGTQSAAKNIDSQGSFIRSKYHLHKSFQIMARLNFTGTQLFTTINKAGVWGPPIVRKYIG
ncbi:hypothetical protein DPMN_014759 [Dreissena polymorpha]|uniref:Uncharacterized protein n=1 Tax=Dreissena polymorpha TaxID=45954 RepID=A0A9D4NBK2_DREPO|nr:hypothetical protein DPMN_014759 [Dreissena polymorpha]